MDLLEMKGSERERRGMGGICFYSSPPKPHTPQPPTPAYVHRLRDHVITMLEDYIGHKALR